MQIPAEIVWTSILTSDNSTRAARMGLHTEFYEEDTYCIVKLSVWISSKYAFNIDNASLYINNKKKTDISIKIAGTEIPWDSNNIQLIYYEEIKILKQKESFETMFTVTLDKILGLYSNTFTISSPNYTINALKMNYIIYMDMNEDGTWRKVGEDKKYLSIDYNLIPINLFNNISYNKQKRFKGWRLDPDSLIDIFYIFDENMIEDKKNIYVYAFYEIEKFTVSFYTELGLHSQILIDKGSNIENYPNKIEDYQNYIYNGWEDKNNRDIKDIKVFENLSLYVKRIPKKILVKYQIENIDQDLIIENLPSEEQFDFNNAFVSNIIPNIKNNIKYKFLYWKDNNNKIYYPRQRIFYSQDIVLTACWETISYSITLKDKIFIKFHNQELIINGNIIEKIDENYEYRGWSYKKQNTVSDFPLNEDNKIVIPANLNQDIIIFPVIVREYYIKYSDLQPDSIMLRAYGTNYLYSFKPKPSIIYRRMNGNEYEYFSHWNLSFTGENYYSHISYNLDVRFLSDAKNTIELTAIFDSKEDTLNYFYFIEDNNKLNIQAESFQENDDIKLFFNKENLQAKVFSEKQEDINGAQFIILGDERMYLKTNGEFIEKTKNKNLFVGCYQKKESITKILGIQKEENGSKKIYSFKLKK